MCCYACRPHSPRLPQQNIDPTAAEKKHCNSFHALYICVALKLIIAGCSVHCAFVCGWQRLTYNSMLFDVLLNIKCALELFKM